MADIKLLNEFYLFLERYENFYKEFLLLESEKYEIITRNEYRSLDVFIKEEQVYLLKSKGFELQRDGYMKNLGNSDLTLRELIEVISEAEIKNKFLELYKSLSDVLSKLKEANRLCNFLIELRLHKVEISLKKIENQPEMDIMYGPSFQDNRKPLNSLSKKV